MLAQQDLTERPVGPDDAAGQGHRRHADRGLLEDLSEPLEVLIQDALVVVVVLMRDAFELCSFIQLIGYGRQRPALRRRPGPVEDLHQRGGHPLDGDGLLEKRGRAELDGAFGQPIALEPGVDDDAGLGGDRQDAVQRVEPVHGRHRQVEQQQVRVVAVSQPDRLDPV